MTCSRGDLVSRVHEFGEIDHLEHVEAGTHLRGRVDEGLAAELEQTASSS